MSVGKRVLGDPGARSEVEESRPQLASSTLGCTSATGPLGSGAGLQQHAAASTAATGPSGPGSRLQQLTAASTAEAHQVLAACAGWTGSNVAGPDSKSRTRARAGPAPPPDVAPVQRSCQDKEWHPRWPDHTGSGTGPAPWDHTRPGSLGLTFLFHVHLPDLAPVQDLDGHLVLGQHMLGYLHLQAVKEGAPSSSTKHELLLGMQAEELPDNAGHMHATKAA